MAGAVMVSKDQRHWAGRVSRLGARLGAGNSGKAGGEQWLLPEKFKALDPVTYSPGSEGPSNQSLRV